MSKLFEYIDTLSAPYEAFFVVSGYEGFPVHSHWHYYMELIYLYEGTIDITCDKMSYTLHKGDLFIFCPKTIHSISAPNGAEFKYGVLKFDSAKLSTNICNGISLRLLFENAADTPDFLLFFQNEEIKDLRLGDIFTNCANEIVNCSYGYDLILQSYLAELLIMLVRVMKKKGFDTDSVACKTAPTTSIETITEYIDAHSSEKINIADLSSMCNMSYSYFAKSFHQMYGRSCKDYLEFVRITKAENLLLYTNLDLTYISLETGFSDCSHLIKIFKKWKGITPKQFRLKHKNK